ncbi:MAG: PilC/PilY family type IV pilus protein [bacterium]
MIRLSSLRKYRIHGICLSSSVIAILLFCTNLGLAQEMAPYCCAPPFVTTVVPPNILISLDNSGSMYQRAYTTETIYMTDTTNYYGYFKPESNYVWAVNHFESDPAGIWPGRILNWATLSRADVAKKVLTGGKGNVLGSVARLLSEGRNSWDVYYRRDASNYNRFYITHSANATYVTVTRSGVNPPINATMSNIKVTVDIPEPEYRGVLDQIGDKDNDRHWDDDAPIFGLWHYNNDRGGHIRDYLGDPDIIDLRNHINDMVCETWTPLAENMFEILHFYSQADAYYFGGDYSESPGALHDPYYDKYLHDMVPCRRSFVLMITDGESTMDYEVPNSDASMPNCNNLQNYYDGINPTLPSSGTDYLDDVCLYGHVNDLRPDTGSGWGARELPDDQSLDIFVIYAFGGIGSNLLKESAMCGGFKDMNGDSLPGPDQAEWDQDGDSIPDNYYEAESGYELEEAIMKAIMQMLERISSSSGVGVVSMGTKTGGATAQSQFYPRRTFPTGEVLTWIGTCQSLWLDPYGWLREDNQQDAVLHLQNDYVITMAFDAHAGGGAGNVVVTRLRDNAGSGDPAQFDTVGQVEIENIIPLWDAGKWLYNHPENERTITAFIDLDGNGQVNPITEVRDLIPGHAAFLRPYMGVSTDTEAETLIRYLRGTDFNGLRTRTADGKVWKLGDIINSNAVAVQGAIERYDFIYGDNSYFDYFESCKDRRQVVYVGGNDGMFHCFNGGKPVDLSGVNPMTPLMYDLAGDSLGAELWAHIPYNLIPHLKWLKEPAYCHVYYNDMKTYVTDAQIFPNDAIHPNGWGTLLIGGMRLGGMPIDNDIDTRTSAYFAIDVTVPETPVPLWEFTHPDLELTVCYSAVVKVDSSWFLVFGSGPMTCSAESNQNAKIFVLDLETGTMLKQWTIPEPNSFISNIFGVDWGMDYTVDRIYLGTCHEDGSLPGDWGGKIYRLLTNDDEDPNAWTLAEIFDMERPITGEGSVATDDYNHLWVYFGSGRFYSDVDEADMTYQRYVGIRDDTTHATTVAGLYDVSNVWIDTLQEVHGAAGITAFEDLIDSVNMATGWYREFDEEGERVISTSLVFGGAVLFSAFVPTGDICSYGGEGNLWALFYRTGTAYITPFLTPDSLDIRHPEKVSLGSGMPSEPSLYVSADQTKVFIQAGGGIVSPETGIPGLPSSGVIIWKGR